MLQVTRAWCYGVARERVEDEYLRQDLAQEAFIAAWQASQKGLGGGAQAKKARWRISDLLRGEATWFGSTGGHGVTHAKPVYVSDYSLWKDESVSAVDLDTRLDIQRAMKKLSPTHRRIVYLRVWEDKTLSQIAEIMGPGWRRLDKIRKHWEDAISTLREELA